MMWPAPEVAEITVFTPESRLILPLRRPAETERQTQLPEPVAAPPLALEPIREPANRHEVVTDPQTGRVRLDIVDDFGCYRNGEHGMIAGSIGEGDPRDPPATRCRPA